MSATIARSVVSDHLCGVRARPLSQGAESIGVHLSANIPIGKDLGAWNISCFACYITVELSYYYKIKKLAEIATGETKIAAQRCFTGLIKSRKCLDSRQNIYFYIILCRLKFNNEGSFTSRMSLYDCLGPTLTADHEHQAYDNEYTHK